MICPTCETELPDDSAFCPVCGKKVESGKTLSEGKPVSVLAEGGAIAAAKSSGKIAAWVLAVLMLVVSIFLGSRLSAANEQIRQLSSQVQSAENRAKTAENRAKTAESRAESLKKAGEIYDDIKSFARGSRGDAVRQYKDLFSYSNAVVIKKGTTETVDIVWANNGTIYSSCDDRSVATPLWADGWKGRTASLYITGNKVGTAVITISNDFNDHTLKILAIVIE